MALSLKSQIAEVKRELRMRDSLYSRERSPAKIRENALHLEHMKAVLSTLEWLEGHNVPPTLPNPGTVAAAMFYVMRLASAPIVKPDTAQKRFAGILEACTNALQGLPPPDILKNDELAASIEALEARIAGEIEEDGLDPVSYASASAKLKRMRAARGSEQ